MALAEEAEFARLDGDFVQYEALVREAYELEASAAWSIKDDLSFEPTRSVIFRSAANLALEAKLHREAERLVSAALSGFPPADIADELRDCLENVYFMRHLDLRGVQLNPGEVQLAIDGDSVAFGMARSNEFLSRVRDFGTLLIRNAERRAGRPFREAGRPKKSILETFEMYISTPRAASFAVTLKLGQTQQLNIPEVDIAAQTVEDVVKGLDAYSRDAITELEDLIPDQMYRENFVAIADSLAPDGKDIKTVGLTTSSAGIVKKVALRRQSKEKITSSRINSPSVTKNIEYQTVEIEGQLLEADATTQDSSSIKIVSAGATHMIKVSRAVMSDVVKPYFDENVWVLAEKRGRELILKRIRRSV